MINYLYLIGLISLYFIIRNKFFSNKKIDNIKKFRNKLTNKEAKIEKIFLRNNERLLKDPNINLTIGLYDQESDLTLKTNIHRARLAKFSKSKLNGEFIYQDSKGNIYKIKNKVREYI
tara:strand:- start:73 stop:426 length:354 start_codon:yes stop_codon:yes gene_type:complete